MKFCCLLRYTDWYIIQFGTYTRVLHACRKDKIDKVTIVCAYLPTGWVEMTLNSNGQVDMFRIMLQIIRNQFCGLSRGGYLGRYILRVYNIIDSPVSASRQKYSEIFLEIGKFFALRCGEEHILDTQKLRYILSILDTHTHYSLLETEYIL